MSPINLNGSFFYGFQFRVNVNGRHGRNEPTDRVQHFIALIQVYLPPAGVMIWIRSNQVSRTKLDCRRLSCRHKVCERWSSCHHRAWISSKSTRSPCLASSSTTAWRQLITWLRCWGHVTIYCTLCVYYSDLTDYLNNPWKTCFRATFKSMRRLRCPDSALRERPCPFINAFLRRCMKLGATHGLLKRFSPCLTISYFWR